MWELRNRPSRPRELDYNEDKLEAAEKIERYTDAVSQGEFVSGEKTVDAVGSI